MRILPVLFLLLFAQLGAYAQSTNVSPLAVFSSEWNNSKYLVCNTAANVSYMSDSEKKAVYILNLARMNPQLFCSTVVKVYPKIDPYEGSPNSSYFLSLVATLSKMTPLDILYPDSLCYVSAYMHSSTAGKIGYVGHDRQTPEAKAKEHFRGECCHFGDDSPLHIIVTLLIDKDVESLGHRKICLGNYAKIGVSTQVHTEYRYMTTLDLFTQ